MPKDNNMYWLIYKVWWEKKKKQNVRRYFIFLNIIIKFNPTNLKAYIIIFKSCCYKKNIINN